MKFIVIQGVQGQTFMFHFALGDRNMQVRFCLKVIFWMLRLDIFWHYNQFLWNAYCAPTTRCEPLLVWFGLPSILSDFFDSEPVWIIHYCEWQLAVLQQYFFLVLLLFYKCCTSEKWIVDLFSKALRIPKQPSNKIWLAYFYLSEPFQNIHFVMKNPVVWRIYGPCLRFNLL